MDVAVGLMEPLADAHQRARSVAPLDPEGSVGSFHLQPRLPAGFLQPGLVLREEGEPGAQEPDGKEGW